MMKVRWGGCDNFMCWNFLMLKFLHSKSFTLQNFQAAKILWRSLCTVKISEVKLLAVIDFISYNTLIILASIIWQYYIEVFTFAAESIEQHRCRRCQWNNCKSRTVNETSSCTSESNCRFSATGMQLYSYFEFCVYVNIFILPSLWTCFGISITKYPMVTLCSYMLELKWHYILKTFCTSLCEYIYKIWNWLSMKQHICKLDSMKQRVSSKILVVK